MKIDLGNIGSFKTNTDGIDPICQILKLVGRIKGILAGILALFGAVTLLKNVRSEL